MKPSHGLCDSLEAGQCSPKAPSKLPIAAHEDVGDGEVPGGPYELVRLGHGSARARRLKPVSPSRRLSAAHKDRERKLVAWGRCHNLRGRRPSVRADLVVATEHRSNLRATRTAEPLAASALRAPVAHSSDVGNQRVHLLGRCRDRYRRFPARRPSHTSKATTGVDAGLVRDGNPRGPDDTAALALLDAHVLPARPTPALEDARARTRSSPIDQGCRSATTKDLRAWAG